MNDDPGLRMEDAPLPCPICGCMVQVGQELDHRVSMHIDDYGLVEIGGGLGARRCPGCTMVWSAEQVRRHGLRIVTDHALRDGCRWAIERLPIHLRK